MTLPSSGALSFSTVNTELGYAGNASLSAFNILNSALAASQYTTMRLKYTNIVYFNQYYYALDTSEGLLRRSLDLVSWTTVLGFAKSTGFSTLVATTSGIYAIKYGTPDLCYSVDGSTWYNASISFGFDTGLAQSAIAYGNTLIVLIKTMDNKYAIAYNTANSNQFSVNLAVSSTLSAASRYAAINSLSYNGTEGQIAFGKPDDPGYLIRIHTFTLTDGISSMHYEIGTIAQPDIGLVVLKWVGPSINRFYCSFVDRQYSMTSYLISAASGAGNLTYARDYQLSIQLANSTLTLETCFTSIPGNPRYVFLSRDVADYGKVYTTNLVAGLSLITTDTTIYKIDTVNDHIMVLRNRGGGGSDIWYSNTSDSDAILKVSKMTTGNSLHLSNLYGRSNTLYLIHSTTSNKLDIRTWALANGWDGTSNLEVINSGNITSDSATSPSLTIAGSFPNGIKLVNTGSITGKGGAGGSGGGGSATAPGIPPTAGSAGGTAIRVSVPCIISNTGTIQGGGGGGGGGRGANIYLSSNYRAIGGGGGGGGASHATYNSAGGAGGAGQSGASGAAGTGSTGSTPGTGGAKGTGSGTYYGSDGGGGGVYGASGSPGSATNRAASGSYHAAGAGGSGGNAVEGNSNITWVSTGTRIGAIA